MNTVATIFFKTPLQPDVDRKPSGRRYEGSEDVDSTSRPYDTTSASASSASSLGKKPTLKIGIVLPKQIFQQRRYQVTILPKVTIMYWFKSICNYKYL
jgi:hypothetical protein